MTDPVYAPGTATGLPATAQPSQARRAAEPGVESESTHDPRDARSAELRAGALLIAVLVVVGVLLGPVWEAWSPPGPVGAVLPGGIQADETEAFVAGDGRYALLTVIVGLFAGWAAWYLLRRVRGPIAAVALVVGGVAGAALTDLVGWAVRGDTDNAEVGTLIRHLPLTVHMHALWFVEATAAVLVYALFVAFAVADDLGRPDPPWEARRIAQHAERSSQPPPWVPSSVETNRSLQEPWRDGDGASPT